MAMNDNAVVNISTARFYTADTGTEYPANPLSPGVDWSEVGHTSLENILSMTTEGGEQTVLGSLQNRNLRTKQAGRSTSFNFSIHQYDEEGLKLFFGSNSVVLADGRVAPADVPVPTETAWLVVVEDGNRYFDFYAQRSEIIGSEDMTLSDTESLATLPLRVTPLNHEGAAHSYTITPVSPKSAIGG